MASRPAPRKTTREERELLAAIRKDRRGKDITMTDIYNYDRQKQDEYNQGVSSGRALEGLTTATPQRIDVDISKARALEGLTNKSSEGMGLANMMGRPGNVDIMYKSGDAYYPALNESLTENLSTMASFIKDNPRLSAETTALGLAGTFGRLSGRGSSFADFLAENANAGGVGIRRGTVESMRGELSRPATTMDVVDAATYATPGAALKGAGLVAKGTALAAKAGRVAGGLAIGSKPARIATGLGSGALGYAGYTEAKPEEAQAFPLGKLLSLGIDSEAAKRLLDTSFNSRVRGDLRRITGDKNLSLREGLKEFAPKGLAQSATQRSGRVGQTGKQSRSPLIEEGAFSVIPTDTVASVKNFLKGNPDVKDGDIEWGHLKARSKGGPSTGSNLVPMRKETNAAIADRNIDEFVDEQIKSGLSLSEVKNKWKLNHIDDSILLGK
jgi:hypothetical protein